MVRDQARAVAQSVPLTRPLAACLAGRCYRLVALPVPHLTGQKAPYRQNKGGIGSGYQPLFFLIMILYGKATKRRYIVEAGYVPRKYHVKSGSSDLGAAFALPKGY